MRLATVDLIPVSVPFVAEKRWSQGALAGSTRVLVRIEAVDGLAGYGETDGSPEVINLLEECRQLLVGRSPFDLEGNLALLAGVGKGEPHNVVAQAVAGVEIACWDLIGKAYGQPICNVIGGLFRAEVSPLSYIFIGDLESRVEEAERWVAKGFRTLKVKVGLDHEDDLRAVGTIRERVGEKVGLIVDPNQAWPVEDAIRLAKELAEFDLLYLEQPTPWWDLDALASVRRGIDLPLAADESVRTMEGALEAIKKEAADILLVNPQDAGGIWEAKKVCALAQAAGLRINFRVGNELGISTAAHLHIAASTPVASLPFDTEYNYSADDILTEPLGLGDGSLKIPRKPGLGVEIDEAKVAQYNQAYRSGVRFKVFSER